MNKREARRIALRGLIGIVVSYQTNRAFRYHEDPSLTEADTLKIDAAVCEIIDSLDRQLRRLVINKAV